MKKEHILIIRLSALGDVVMTVPVVYSLAKQYPDVRITVLSKPFAKTLFQDLAPNISFMSADVKGEYHGVKGLNALYRRLTAKHFTAIADLHDTLRSKYLRRLKLVNRHHKILQQLPTSFENYADVFKKLGFPLSLDFSSLPQLSEVPKTTNIIPKIGIAPFAAHKGKIYPLEMMEEVIKLLIQRNDKIKIYLFGGGKKEMEIINDWVLKYPQCTNVSEKAKTLSDELEVMKQLSVMISMDSANMHLASLVATPVVSIWGATHPYAGFMGWNQSKDNAIQLDMNCRPCSIYGKKPCHRGDYACMTHISPEMITEHVLHLINI